jgi:hypothetical protein
MAFDEDLSLFFDVSGGFAVAAVITMGSSTRSIPGIFNDPTQSVEIYDTAVEAGNPFLTAQTSDLAGVKRGHTATMNAVVYKIERVHHDGTGLSTVYLSE